MFDRLKSMLVKEYIQALRDPRMRFVLFVIPVFQTIVFGYAVNTDVRHIATAVYDRDNSPESRDLVQKFLSSGYFDLVEYLQDDGRVRELLDRGTVRMVLHLDKGFGATLAVGRTAPVQIILDGTDANTANIIEGYVQGVALAFNENVQIERLNRKGVTQTEIPVTARIRFWFNEDLESKNFIIPGLIVVIMTMVGALLTALAIVREVERGSMESLLATPLRKTELILGKIGPYFLLGLIDLGIAVAMGEFLFQVPLKGSIVLYVALSAVFLLVMLGMGMLISILSENQLQAYQMATLITFLPAFLLSGFVFAIPLMPVPLQFASYLVPARYLVTICKGIYLKGVGLEILWPSAVMLVFFAVFFLALAIRRFRHKIG